LPCFGFIGASFLLVFFISPSNHVPGRERENQGEEGALLGSPPAELEWDYEGGHRTGEGGWVLEEVDG
jgi:hypothetical protein